MLETAVILLTLTILSVLAILAQFHFNKKIKEGNYELKVVRVLNVETNLDIKNGTSYQIQYDNNLPLVTSKERPHDNKLTHTCKVYINTNDNTDIIPKKNYYLIIVGCAVLIIVQLYVFFLNSVLPFFI